MSAASRKPTRRALTFFLGLGLGVATSSGSVPQAAAQGAFYDGLQAEDAARALSAFQQTLETRVSHRLAHWRNDATGTSGSVMPLRTFRIRTGHYCREYVETILATGKIMSRVGTACRDDGGAWIPVPQ
ncbi:MAG: RT0821/Lpp0805 family surface protein [Kiloniellaceae bacterium]